MVAEEVLDRVRQGMKTTKVPTQFDKVYKDECMLSFANPFAEGGLFVSLATWYGYGRERVQAYGERTGETLFLHEAWTKVARAQPDEGPTKVAIGVEGGFAGGTQYDIVKEHQLAIVTKDGVTFVPLSQDLPTLVSNACDAVVASDGVAFKEEVAAWEDVDAQTDSKFAADLPQVENPPKIPSDPSKWVCEASGQRENLWLNLSTGFIGGGRKQWDGSGGSGTALDHFEATGQKYPLAVKLGTITPNGADVYSYHPDEDRSCRDPKLAEHLAHFGIDIMQQQKTVKTTTELDLELNKAHDFSKITEGDKDLVPAYGPGLQGLNNLGNSCYMASVLQALFSVPEVVERYAKSGEQLLAAPGNPAEDALAQTAKVGMALVSGKHRKAGEEENPAYQVHPRMFKSLVSRGHKEFATGRQQDAQEYFAYLLDQLTRAETAGKQRLDTTVPTESHFTYSTVERVECGESGKVRYSESTGNMLKLSIPLSAATNAAAVEESEAKRQKMDDKDKPEAVCPEVPFAALLEKFAAEGIIQDFASSATPKKTFAKVSTRLKTFPKCLLVYLSRYYITDKWEPKKMEVVVPAPETLDLSALRGTSELKPGEEALPEDTTPAAAAAPQVVPDEMIMSQLLSMDFHPNGCKKACIAVKNQSAEAAMEWIFANMENPDFADPPVEKSAPQAAAPASFSPDDIAMLTSLGFTEKHVTKALKATGGSTERAADWLFSHPEGEGGDEEEGAAGMTPGAKDLDDGRPEYTLTGMISHIGSNTGSGHYVAHVKKEGKWYIFNDEKVCESQDPPFAHAYIYLYRRNDA